MADLAITGLRSSRRHRLALVVAMTAAACSSAPQVAVERSMLTPMASEITDESDAPDDEASLPGIGIDQEVLDSLDELEASEPLPAIDEPFDGSEPADEEPAEEEAATEAPEDEPEDEEGAGDDDRLRIDDVVWVVPDDNDRWDLDRDGFADTVAPNPWQIIDDRLPLGDALGDAWDSGYRSTSIVGGGRIVPELHTDCDEFDLLTGLNGEYHGIQSWEREGETIDAFVVALDDSTQAAGIAEIFGGLSTTCPIIGPDPQWTQFQPFEALPLPTAHDDVDSLLIEYVDEGSKRVVARSHGALLHIVTLDTWVDAEPSERALTDFATIVDHIVETTPGAEPAVDPGTNRLTPTLPTGDDAGIRWDAPVDADLTNESDPGRSTCVARAAFGVLEDRLEVAVSSMFDADVYAYVSVGEFDSTSEADLSMIDAAQLLDCPAPELFSWSVMDHDIDVDASGHAIVPFTYDEETLDGTLMDGVILTVGPNVAMIVVAAFPNSYDSDVSDSETEALHDQLQLLVAHMVDELEALS